MSKKTKVIFVLLLLTLIVPAFVFAQTYTTYSASSNMKNQIYRKSDTVFIISSASNFIWNRVMEESLQSEFQKNGITVFLLTDYMDISEGEDVDAEEIHKLINKTKTKLLLEISISEIYTYTYGEGISKLESDVVMYSCSNFSAVLRVGLSTEADTNDMLSFSATRKPAIESVAKCLVEEYLKYVK